MLDKAIRELDRERMALQNQEKKVIAEIKKTAKQGQMVGCHLSRASAAMCTTCALQCAGLDLQDAVKVMAKSLVRNRHAVTKMYGLKSQLQAVSLRIQVQQARKEYLMIAIYALHDNENLMLLH